MTVNQKGASASGDVVGRDKVTHNHPPPLPLTKIDKLKARLQQEVDAGACSADLIDQLKHFKKPVPQDGVVGLEAKLEVAGRKPQVLLALEMKEQFAKLLEKWSLYASAQEIFAHLLAMADYRYATQIFPQVGALPAVVIDELVDQKIVGPAIEEVGIDVFSLNHHTAMGMVYWLAEQCRVKWHE
jgi:hypothetical protein